MIQLEIKKFQFHLKSTRKFYGIRVFCNYILYFTFQAEDEKNS